MKRENTFYLLGFFGVANVVIAFLSSYYLHDHFYGTESTLFRSTRLAPAVGILQIHAGQAVIRSLLRRLGAETDEQATAFDYFASLVASASVGLGVIMADMVRPPAKK